MGTMIMATTTPTQLANVRLPVGATEVDDWADMKHDPELTGYFKSSSWTATAGSTVSDHRHPVPMAASVVSSGSTKTPLTEANQP
jgi:hypothetical protein